MPGSPYKLRVPEETAELVRNLHPDLKRKLRISLREILHEPISGKALKDELDGLRSFRVGTFRIIYRIAPRHIIEVVAIGPRIRIYAETLRLIRRNARQAGQTG